MPLCFCARAHTHTQRPRERERDREKETGGVSKEEGKREAMFIIGCSTLQDTERKLGTKTALFCRRDAHFLQPWHHWAPRGAPCFFLSRPCHSSTHSALIWKAVLSTARKDVCTNRYQKDEPKTQPDEGHFPVRVSSLMSDAQSSSTFISWRNYSEKTTTNVEVYLGHVTCF